MSKREVHLVAQLAAASAADLAHTTNLLLAAERRRSVEFADALIRLVEGLHKIPAMMRTAYIDNLLFEVGLDYAHATDRSRWFEVPGEPGGEHYDGY